MAGTTGSEAATRSQSHKARPSSDRGLQPDPVKLESLVSRISHGAVNTFPDLVHTARQAMGAGGA